MFKHFVLQSTTSNNFSLNTVYHDHFIRNIYLNSLIIKGTAGAIDDISILLTWEGNTRSTQGRSIVIPMYPNDLKEFTRMMSLEKLPIVEITALETKSNNPILEFNLFKGDGSALVFDEIVAHILIEYDHSKYYHETNTREDFRARNLVV